MYKNTLTHYGSIAKLFHWLIFFLVAFMLLLGYFMDDVSDEAARHMIVNIHKVVGVSVLAIMILRVIWAVVNPKPKLFNTRFIEKFLAHGMHVVLYIILLLMPLSGWVMTSYSGKVPHIFDWKISLPLEQNKEYAERVASVHNALAIVIIVLVSLHVLAALYHYFIKKDNILQRMTPGEK